MDGCKAAPFPLTPAQAGRQVGYFARAFLP